MSSDTTGHSPEVDPDRLFTHFPNAFRRARRTAARVFVEAVFASEMTCSWCAAPLYREAKTPDEGPRRLTDEAGKAYFAPTVVDGRRRRGGKRTYCDPCGRTEPPAAWENRDQSERHRHLDNLLEYVPPCKRRAVEPPCSPPNVDAAHDTVSRLNRRDDLTDLDVLAAAVAAALSSTAGNT